MLALYNAASVGGQIIVGFLSDRFSYPLIITGLGVSSSLVAIFGLGFADTLPKTIGFALCFGAVGGFVSTWTTVAQEVAGNNVHLPSLIFGAFSISRGAAAIVGPIVASKLFAEIQLDAYVFRLRRRTFVGTNTKAAGRSSPGTFGNFGFKNVIIFVAVMALLSGVGGVCLEVARRWKKRSF